jgi:protein-tyrosine phosphatase
MIINVLFVCTGNICRSPMAEAVFNQLVHEAGLAAQISADSAGTSHFHNGEPAHRGTLAILQKYGIAYNGRSRPLVYEDAQNFEYLIAMDDDHFLALQNLARRAEKVTVARLLDYAPDQAIREVPDPYYDNTFPEVYDLVLAGAKGLLTHIRQEHGI